MAKNDRLALGMQVMPAIIIIIITSSCRRVLGRLSKPS